MNEWMNEWIKQNIEIRKIETYSTKGKEKKDQKKKIQTFFYNEKKSFGYSRL